MDLEEVVDGAEEVVEEVDGAEGEVRLPPVHGHALAWLGRLAPRLELRRARQLRREPHSDEGELPSRRGGDQHVHGATHEPHLHAVHAPAPPRRCQPAVQDDGHFRIDSDSSDPPQLRVSILSFVSARTSKRHHHHQERNDLRISHQTSHFSR
jgi:hypothetical protein